MHDSAPEEFKKRMLAEKKSGGGYLPGSSRTSAVPKSEKPCFQFH